MEAIVYKHRSGAWVAECRETGKRISGFCDTELEAVKIANSEGYIVI